MNMADEYPECEKMGKVKDKSQTIGEFLEWLSDEGITLAMLHEHDDDCYEIEDEEDGSTKLACELSTEVFYPIHTSIEQLLAKYFDIDLNKVDKEKQALLAKLRGGDDVAKGQ